MGSKKNGKRINSPVYKLNNHIGIQKHQKWENTKEIFPGKGSWCSGNSLPVLAGRFTREKRETNRRVLGKKDLEEYFLIPEKYDIVQSENKSGCGSLSLGSWEKRTNRWYSFGMDRVSWSEPSESYESSSEFLGVLRPSSFKLLSSWVSHRSTSSPWPPFSALLGSLERKASANH